MNVNEHRRALEFGFTENAFTKYGWFAAPQFLDFECISFEQSDIRIGHGPNGTWAYALRICFGVAGESGPLWYFVKNTLAARRCWTQRWISSKLKYRATLGILIRPITNRMYWLKR